MNASVRGSFPPNDQPNPWAKPEHSPMPAKKTISSKSKTTKKAASPKKRAASKSAKSTAGDQEVTIDRRREANRRDETTEEAVAPIAQPPLEKREKVQRRRQIDPTTCERDYSDTEVEFMNAMDEYKRTSGRMFPTCSEILEVVRDLGYVKQTPIDDAATVPVIVDTETSETVETPVGETGQSA